MTRHQRRSLTGAFRRRPREADNTSVHSCCRRNRRRRMESSSRQQDVQDTVPHRNIERTDGRREAVSERLRTEATERNEKKSTRSRVCRFAKFSMGVFIALGIILVFYVITTTIIDGASPLDSLFDGKHYKKSDSEENSNQNKNFTSIKKERNITATSHKIPNYRNSSFPKGEEIINNTGQNNVKKNLPANTNDFYSDKPDGRSNSAYYPVLLDVDSVDNDSNDASDYNYDGGGGDAEGERITELVDEMSKSNHALVPEIATPNAHHQNHQMTENSDINSAKNINRAGFPFRSNSHSPRPYWQRDTQFQIYGDRDRVSVRDSYEEQEASLHEWPILQETSHYPRVSYNRKADTYFQRPFAKGYRAGQRRRLPKLPTSSAAVFNSERKFPYSSQIQDHSYSKEHSRRPRLPSSGYKPLIRANDRYRNSPSYTSDPFSSRRYRKMRPIRIYSYNDGRALIRPYSNSHPRLQRYITTPKSKQNIARQRPPSERHYRSRHSPPPEFQYPSNAGSIQDIIQYMNANDRNRYHSGSYGRDNYDTNPRDSQDSQLPSGYVIGNQNHMIEDGISESNDGYLSKDNVPLTDDDKFSSYDYVAAEGPYREAVSDSDDEAYGANNGNPGSTHIDHITRYYESELPFEKPFDTRYQRPNTSLSDHSTAHHSNKILPPVRNTLPHFGNTPSENVGTDITYERSKPFNVRLDIYPSEDVAQRNDKELQTKISLPDMDSTINREHGYSTPEKHEVLLHINIYSKPPFHSSRSSSRHGGLSLDVPLMGNLSPLDIYRAVFSNARNPPVASAQTRDSTGNSTLHKYHLTDFKLSETEDSELYRAIEKALMELNPFLPEANKIIFLNNPLAAKDPNETGHI